MKAKYFTIFPILGALLGGIWIWGHQTAGPSAASDGYVATINAPALLDHVRALNSPLVMVNFWASWCTPCRTEFPGLLALRDKLKARGFEIVFVSIDDPPDLPAAEEFLHQSGVNFLTYYKGTESIGLIKQIFPDWQGAVPTSLLFGPGGKLVDAWEGESTAAELEQRVNRQLRGS